MRITNNMMITNTITNINNAANRLNDAENQVATEKKISLPSDDPVVATRAIKYRDYVNTIEQYQKNVSDVQSWQSVTDTALSDLSDVITQVRTLAVKASSSTLTSSDKQNIATEVSTLRDQAIDIMNSTYGGRYIFGGYSTGEAPYKLESTAIGDAVTFKGKYLSLGGVVSADVSDSTITTFASANTGYSSTSLGTVTSTGTNTYDTSNIGISSGLAAGTYSVGVAYDSSTSTYTLTMSDGTSSYTATTTSATSPVTFTTSSGEVSLAAPASGYASGDAFSFNVNATTQSIKCNIGHDSEVTINTEGQDVVGEGSDNLFNTFSKLLIALGGGTTYKTYDSTTGSVTTNSISDISSLLTDLDTAENRVTTAQAALGASESHVSQVSDSLGNDYTTYTTLMSNNEDVDVSKATIEESSAQTVYDAALSVGAKAISKTLVDYLA